MKFIKNLIFLFTLLFSFSSFCTNTNYFTSLKEKMTTLCKYNKSLKIILSSMEQEYFRKKTSKEDKPPCEIINKIFNAFLNSIEKINKLYPKNKNNKNITKFNKILEKESIEIAKNCTSYIYLQIQLKQELYKIKFYQNIQQFLQDGLLDVEKKDEYMFDCIKKIDELFNEYDDYVIRIIDFLEAVKLNNSVNFSDIDKNLIIDLSDKIVDEQILIYKLKKNNKNITHLLIEKNKENKSIILDGSFHDDSFFWYINYDNKYSKIFIDKKAANNGILFAFFDKSVKFYIYHKNSSFPKEKNWSIISNEQNLEPIIIKANKRVKNTYCSKFNLHILYINFNDINNLERIINSIKEYDLLNFDLFIKIINWLTNVEYEYEIFDEKILPFYPKELKIKEIEYQISINKKEQKTNSTLGNIYNIKQATKTSKEYKNMIDNALVGQKNIGCKMLKKCVNWWWKSHNKELKSSQKGSHIKLKQKNEKSITLVKLHGIKASSGEDARHIRNLLLNKYNETE